MNFELLKKENILHDYEQVRLRNKRRLQERQEEIYAKIPEIKQLQSENKLYRSDYDWRYGYLQIQSAG